MFKYAIKTEITRKYYEEDWKILWLYQI
jgi:hypothetical protein